MRFRSGAVAWANEVTGKKTLSGKYFKFLFLKNAISGFGSRDYELVIEAKSQEKAQQAYELFLSALTLVNTHVVYSITDMPEVVPMTMGLSSRKSDVPWYVSFRSFTQSGIYEAAMLAVNASFRKIYVFSLSKYLFACSQHSNYLVDIDPHYGEYHKLTKKPLDHLRYAYAIYALYSVLEELGLEMRASANNPSKVKGEWVPKVKADLEKRLRKSKVKLERKVMWNLRSRPTKVHPKDVLVLQGKASWARYSVRDSSIELVDAISYASWLRSRIVAHKLSDSFLSISIYDVANINFHVRQILFDVLGFQIKGEDV